MPTASNVINEGTFLGTDSDGNDVYRLGDCRFILIQVSECEWIVEQYKNKFSFKESV